LGDTPSFQPQEVTMKPLFALVAVIAALALAAPAGAMPIIDPPTAPHAAAPPAQPTRSPDGSSLLVVLVVGGGAFLAGAGVARVARVPRRRAATNFGH
jgi:hypothetical protein